MKRPTFVLPVVIVCLVGLSAVPFQAQEPPETAATAVGADPAPRSLLDAIRDDLVELRFEKALAAIEALLGAPGMVEADLAEALVLRSQAHVAFGDLDAAEQDFREILRLRPAYVPDASLTPSKGMQRFDAARADLVGRIRLDLDPPQAQLTVDGRPVRLDVLNGIAVLAGEHRLGASHDGFDPQELTIAVEADKESPVRLQLVPNARTVILATAQDGVEVWFDGEKVGQTVRPKSLLGASAQPATLVLEQMPLGQHVIELRKGCYRTERIEDLIDIDLLDRSAKRYDLVSLAPARSTVGLEGGPTNGEVLVDGAPRGRLPLDPFEVCPGEREIEVRRGSRVVWKSRELLRESTQMRFEIQSRPNVALLGVVRWPEALAEFGSAFNTTVVPLLLTGRDLSTLEGWSGVELPQHTDLALAVVASLREGARNRWYVYSPILEALHVLEGGPPLVERPTWQDTLWGVSTVDSRLGGATLVAQVVAGGAVDEAGLAPGHRVLGVDGTRVDDSASLLEALAAAAARGGAELEWSVGDETARARVEAVRSPWLRGVEQVPIGQAQVLAAWAVVDGLGQDELAATALANLAMLFSRFGHDELAVETWRRVRWGQRAGIGEGTKQYYMAQALERLGREDDAVAAYRLAAQGTNTVFNDEGPRVAPAARDRLADLGLK